MQQSAIVPGEAGAIADVEARIDRFTLIETGVCYGLYVLFVCNLYDPFQITWGVTSTKPYSSYNCIWSDIPFFQRVLLY